MKKRLCVYGLIGILLGIPALTGAVPNKVWLLPGSPLKFADAAQSGVTATLTMTGLTAGNGQCSVRYDKDALKSASGAMPHFWRWGGTIQLNGANVPNDVVEVSIAMSDGTIEQGNLGSTGSSVAMSAAKKVNMTFAGVLIVDQTTTATSMMGAGTIEIPTRYFRLCVYNATGLPFVTSTSVHTFYMTPYSIEIQASLPLDYDKRTTPPALAVA